MGKSVRHRLRMANISFEQLWLFGDVYFSPTLFAMTVALKFTERRLSPEADSSLVPCVGVASPRSGAGAQEASP